MSVVVEWNGKSIVKARELHSSLRLVHSTRSGLLYKGAVIWNAVHDTFSTKTSKSDLIAETYAVFFVSVSALDLLAQYFKKEEGILSRFCVFGGEP